MALRRQLASARAEALAAGGRLVAELDFIQEVKAENAVQARAARPRSAHPEHRVCVCARARPAQWPAR